MATQLGRIGVWALESALTPAVARELEQAGYGAIWIGGSPGGDLALVDGLLDATERIVVATGIVNVWNDDARDIAAAHRRITGRFGERFLLGIGIGHPEATSDYRHPYQTLVDYLDVLDAEGVPQHERVLAALGPKVLRLSRDRSAGAHPYLTTPDHTRTARDIVGPGVLLAPEQKVVLGTDPDAARARGRKVVARYLALTNYVSNLRRSGFTDDDLAGAGSDRLVDALVGHGDPATAAQHVRAHLDAGADHVPVQLLVGEGEDPVPGLRALAEVLTG